MSHSFRTLHILYFLCLVSWLNGRAIAGGSEFVQLVSKWHTTGEAAGNAGDYYDNRDRNHSTIRVSDYKELQRVVYTEEEKNKRQDWGLSQRVLPHVVIGNSSTAANVEAGGSLGRVLYSIDKGLMLLSAQYFGNNLYVYPEHRDHDYGLNGAGGYGDVFPTNTPYLIVSQGSSGSDKPFVNAFFHTLAAFQPETKEVLVKNKVLMPTLQQIFRISNPVLDGTDDYMTGRAHPTAFSKSSLDTLAMVKRAQRMELKDIPPIVALNVVDENPSKHGVDYFDPNLTEKVADTAACISRIYRRSGGEMRLVVSAAQSQDGIKRPLRIHWKLLRGDPERVRIKPTKDGRTAELIIKPPYLRPIAYDPERYSSRVDIGVFAENDTTISAPAFVTVYGLANEERWYYRDGRVHSIHYQSPTAFGLAESKSISKWKQVIDTFASAEFDDVEMLLFGQIDPETRAELQIWAKKSNDYIEQHTDFRKRISTIRTRIKGDLSEEEKKALKKEERSLSEELDRVVQEFVDHLEGNLMESEQSARQIIKNTLWAVIDDPLFSIQHKELIDKMSSRVSEKAVKAFRELKDDLVERGYFLKKKQGLWGKSTLTLPDNLDQIVLPRFHAYLNFNSLIVDKILYPDFLNCTYNASYVDKRLAYRKPWRDVYRYDEEGNLLGWTRYHDGKTKQFDAKGQRQILDLTGAVRSTKPVKYTVDKTGAVVEDT